MSSAATVSDAIAMVVVATQLLERLGKKYTVILGRLLVRGIAAWYRDNYIDFRGCVIDLWMCNPLAWVFVYLRDYRKIGTRVWKRNVYSVCPACW